MTAKRAASLILPWALALTMLLALQIASAGAEASLHRQIGSALPLSASALESAAPLLQAGAPAVTVRAASGAQG